MPRISGQVTDLTGELSGSTGEIETALDAVLAADGVQLFVVFVQTTGDMTSTEFADETARVNSFGGDDALLLVALEDRTDAIWVSDALPITDDEINEVLVNALEPGLRDGDFPGAVIAAAQALGRAATDVPAPIETKPVDPGGPIVPFPPDVDPGSPADNGSGLLGLVGLVLLALGLVSAGVWGASRFASWRDAEERDRRTGKLAREANVRLIALDDRIRAADQEAGFVDAQFGSEEAAPLRAAVASAKTELGGAFEIRQRLDDDQPEDPPTREAMLNDILERLGRAGAALDAQAARIDQLRNLEREAPAILASLPDQVAAQEARLPAAAALLQDLRTRYAEPAWAAIRGNVEEATKGLAGARAAIERGNAAVASGGAGAGGPARQIVVAQQGIAGSRSLLDGIDVAARTIRDAEAALDGQLEQAADDIEAARAAVPRDPDGTPPHDSEFEAAEAALRSASAAAMAAPPEPIGAGRAAAEAARLAAQLLATVRADAEQQARFVAALDATFRAAHAEVDRAADFIATRSSGVRRRARTRLAEAERLLDIAEAGRDTNPKQAMADAKRADDLAGEAYSLASTDFARWDQPRGGGGGGGNDIAGAILGGIIGGILSGGGRHGGGGWNGSPWGSSGPSLPGGGSGGGGWGGGGHSSGGGFGGFGGGGSGGGGGGHSQGGRW